MAEGGAVICLQQDNCSQLSYNYTSRRFVGSFAGVGAVSTAVFYGICLYPVLEPCLPNTPGKVRMTPMQTTRDAAYQAALDYIYSFVDFSRKRNLTADEARFDLGRMREFAARLGNPQRAYPVIHIAGTKGKGSVASLCAGALQEAGYRVGLYTSPHMQEFTERMRVDGEPIPPDTLAALVEELRPHVAAIPFLTTFEIITALAFLYFARRQVDVAVIEVGLGGRLDATNIVEPALSVVTSLSYDHAAILGDTLAKIAAEKAGIVKPGRPVVLAPQREEARRTVARIAAERGAPLVQVGADWFYAPLSHSLEGQTMLVWSAEEQPLVDAYINSGGEHEWEPTRLQLHLLGHHQVENAATAFAALQVFRETTLPVPLDAIQRGFARARWPGRFELLRRYPPVVIDAAHNRDSALRLRLALDDYFPTYPVVLVFGASEDKDVEGMFAELLPRVQHVIATRSVHPRALDPQKLVPLGAKFARRVQVIAPIEDALEEALRLAGEESLVLVTGSIFVAAAARSVWRVRKCESVQV